MTTTLCLSPGAPTLAGEAFLGYAVGVMNDSIWKGQAWRTTSKFILDGAVYAVLTAGTFGWLWPAAAA